MAPCYKLCMWYRCTALHLLPLSLSGGFKVSWSNCSWFMSPVALQWLCLACWSCELVSCPSWLAGWTARGKALSLLQLGWSAVGFPALLPSETGSLHAKLVHWSNMIPVEFSRPWILGRVEILSPQNWVPSASLGRGKKSGSSSICCVACIYNSYYRSQNEVSLAAEPWQVKVKAAPIVWL